MVIERKQLKIPTGTHYKLWTCTFVDVEKTLR